MKITKSQLRRLIKENSYDGNLTIEDVKKVFPNKTEGERTDIHDEFGGSTNNVKDLEAAYIKKYGSLNEDALKITKRQLRQIILEQANFLNENPAPHNIIQASREELKKIAQDLGAADTSFVGDVQAAIGHAVSTPDNLGGPEALRMMVTALALLIPSRLPTGNVEILEQVDDTEAKRLVNDIGADELWRLDQKDDGSFDEKLGYPDDDLRSKVLELIGAEVTVHGSGGSDILGKIS